MATTHYDVIVLGCGGIGSAALWRLAERGAHALGIDRFRPPHDQGSSHGQTRIIRQAYFEHPDYVPLVRRAYNFWAELEALSGERLFERTGLIEVGPPDGVVVPGVLRAAAEHDLAIEPMTPADLIDRWPQFRPDDDQAVVFEPTAGFLHVERCVAACLAAAESAGAETQFDTLVHRWRDDGSAISMETSHGTFTCDRLVIAAGPWAGQMLADLGAPLQLRRQSLFWFEAPANHSFHKMPPFLFEDPQGAYYGFPATSPFGVKVGDHGYGQPLASPEAIDRDIDPSDQQRLEAFVARRLPGVSQSITNHATCYYTMSPDEHFLVDRLPSDERICFAAGLSGHGYKFAPVLGEALADLATEGSTALPVDFLSARRFTTH